MSKEIILTQDKVAIVDDADFDNLNQYKWFAHKESNIYYAERGVGKHPHRMKIHMHRVVLDVVDQPLSLVDHINRDGLDNRRVNLRIATRSQNAANCKKRDKGSSQYKGVDWDKKYNKWRGRIKFNSKRMHLGYYTNELEAALAYDKKAIELFGEFAATNKSLGLINTPELIEKIKKNRAFI